jgi:hypothetical protein
VAVELQTLLDEPEFTGDARRTSEMVGDIRMDVSSEWNRNANECLNIFHQWLIQYA